MFKKFLSAIILVFAFLFLNVSEVKAVENTSGLPDEVFANAGIGTKMGYWAVVNYGEEYIDSKDIVIDLDKNAISNLDIEYILIDETNCVGSGQNCIGEGRSVYYKRNVDANFSSRIEYTLKNGYIQEKSVTIFLLTALSDNPSESLVVDMITIPINQKRPISGIDDSDILITQTLNATRTASLINVEVTNSDYVLKNVRYKYEKDSSFLTSYQRDINKYEFYAYQNGIYHIVLEDVFGGEPKEIEIEVSGIIEPPIIIEAIPSITTPTNRESYNVIINLYKLLDTNRVKLSYSDLFASDTLVYEYEGESSSIKEQLVDDSFYMVVKENGEYIIRASINGSYSEIRVVIDNFDRENPFIQVGNNLIVYTESIDLFNPRNEVFAYDNVTSGEILMDHDHLKISYYYIDDSGEEVVIGGYYNHLYSVRELYVVYTVTDEAGNSSSGTCKVTPIDDTKPTISHSSRKMILYINDAIASENPDIANNRIETFFKLVVNDNSLYEGSNRTVTFTKSWDLKTETDSNGLIRVSELTKNGRIFVKATDEAGNESEEIVLPVEVCERLIKIEAKEYQYAVYGEYSKQTNPILYHCVDVARDEYGNEIYDEYGNTIPAYVDCSLLLLEKDKLIGSLYIDDNAKYVDKYEIKYDKINVPSKLYSLDYGDRFEEITFEIIARKLKVIADPVGKLYLERDPDLTYHIDTSVCGLSADQEMEAYIAYYEALLNESPGLDLKKVLFDGAIYRCSEVTGDKLKGSLTRWEEGPRELSFVPGYEDYYDTEYYEVDGISPRELVWFKTDDDGNQTMVPRPVFDPGEDNGGLYVDEAGSDGTLDNYNIEFIEGTFTIYTRAVTIDIDDKEKIYGENDPVFTIADCEIYIYVGEEDPDDIKDGYTPIKDCMKELQITLRREDGETVVNGPYEISGIWYNLNYLVSFNEGYLTINKRDLSIKVKGDELTPGKYTITYEDDLPEIEVYDDYELVDTKGVANNPSIGIADQLNVPLEFSIYDSYGNLLTYGADGLPNYAADKIYYIKLKEGTTVVIDKNGDNADSNYNLDFETGEIEVIKKKIFLVVKENPAGSKLDLLRKIYGDEDAIYDENYLEAMFPEQKHIVLDSNGFYFVEVANEVTLDNGEIYIPRDNKIMKYYLKRDEGIYVGLYPIRLEKTEGCGNYDVYLQEEFYEIGKRDIRIVIGSQNIIYKEQDPIGEFTYDIDLASRSLQYNDKLKGEPNVSSIEGCYVGVKPADSDLPYCNVGNYPIGGDYITVVDGDDETKDLKFNYNFIITDGNIVVEQRDIRVIAKSAEKWYGRNDPVFEFIVTYKGVEEELPTDQYEGALGRESRYNDVEIPRDEPYDLNQGTFKIKNHGSEENPIENYRIIGWELERKLTIKKLSINIKANSTTLMYGENYSEQLHSMVTGDQPAVNPSIVVWINPDDETKKFTLEDHLEGSVFISDGPVDGYGVYTISCSDFRVVRYINDEVIDVSSYYNITREDGALTVNPRELTIRIKEGLNKVYGNEDPSWDDLENLITITCRGAEKCLVEETDKLTGEVSREPGENVGEYKISISNLMVQRAPDHEEDDEDGKKDYELKLAGNPVFIITKRHLKVEADHKNIIYGDAINLTYTIGGDHGLASRDKLEGSLVLSPAYDGCDIYHDEEYKKLETICGSYAINKGTLTLTNEENYETGWFIKGVLTVQKRTVNVYPIEDYLYKVYGTKDPEFRFVMDYEIPYTGSLSRDMSKCNQDDKYGCEHVGEYPLNNGTLQFVGEKNYNIVIKNAKLKISPRDMKITVKPNLGKIYKTPDPSFDMADEENRNKLVDIEGTLAFEDRFTGSLLRDDGTEVGYYRLHKGNFQIFPRESNYNLTFIEGTFEIYYDNIKSLKIVPKTDNKYQVIGSESEVKLEAEFNIGANPEYLNDVEWTLVKRLGNGDEIDWTDRVSRNITTNEVSFFPSGLGIYIVKAKYGGFSDIYEVHVETSTVRNVYIKLEQDLSGGTTQILGQEQPMTYSYSFTGEIKPETNVRWYVNGELKKEANANNYEMFTFTPNGKGIYEVYAMIIDKQSEKLTITVNNNNAPVITLKGDLIKYIEVKSGEKYVDLGFGESYIVTDDVTSEEWLRKNKITPSGIDKINTDVVGTYYVRYDAVDEHGNYAISVYRQVVVRDSTPPVVTVNECEGGIIDITLLFGEEYIECYATATDNYDEGNLPVYISNPIVFDKVGLYTVTYMAYDSSGNLGYAERKVEIVDNMSPIINLIGDEVIFVEVNTEYKDQGARVIDNVDGTFIIYSNNFTYNGRPIDKIDTTKLGTYTARYDYTDSSGLPGAGKTRTIVVQDTTAPVITLIGSNPYIVRYSNQTVNFEDPGAIVTDNYDKNLTYTTTGTIGYELGTYYLYYDAIDSSGNPAERVTRQIVVVDVRNPIITFLDPVACPQYMTIEAVKEKYNKECDIPGIGIEIDDDNGGNKADLYKNLTVTGTVDDTTVGVYTISYDVIDSSGNSAVTLRRYVNVVDTIAPTINLQGGNPSDGNSVIVEVFEEYTEYGAVARDLYDDYHDFNIVVTITPSVNVNWLGEYEVYYDAVDSNGNRAETVVRKVYVKDTKPPVITLIGPNPIILERGTPYVEYKATVVDNYDGQMTKYTISNAPSGMILGEYEVIYSAIDSSGNIGQTTRIVRVVDTIPPTVLGVADGMYYRNPVSIYFVPTPGTNEELRGWLNGEEITSPWFVDEEGEYELHVEDDAGNSVDIWFAIDVTPPLILGVKDGEYTNRETVEVYSNEKIKYYAYRYQSGDWITSEDQRVYFEKEGIYRIQASDMAGNISETIVFIIDKTPPIYSLTGIDQKGIAANDVGLVVEENATVIVNAAYKINNSHIFTENGYYQVTIRDLAGNVVTLQFVINKKKEVVVDEKTVEIITQHNANKKIEISGTSYPRDSGYMVVKPLEDGGFEYIKGKLFSEAEYQKLINGETLEYAVSGTGDSYMYVAFVVDDEILNQFATQTVDDEDDDKGGAGLASMLFIAFILIGGGFLWFFLKRRRKEEEEDEDEEIIVDDY